ncbi:MAG: site-specific integrase [Cryobacterium sp.]|nr:site-specific integrase [Oligoflexia bacterium]
MQKRQRKPINEGRTTLPLASAVKSFMGHLEGSGKAKHTIDSYRFDLLSFGEFLLAHRGKPTLDLKSLARKDLERYHDWLKLEGQKTNTRRRKLMTVRKLMHYLTARKKLDLDIAKKLLAPEKIERVPLTIDLALFREKISGLPVESYFQARNAALLLLLSDTGCSVSELSLIRWSAYEPLNTRLKFYGKAERESKLRPDTITALTQLKELARPIEKPSHHEDSDELLFIGFNRHGPMRIGKKALGITPRGIEMLVKGMSETLGFPGVTPRVLRHSAVVDWYKSGIQPEEIQKRLGLKTAYTFRIYEPIFNAIRSKTEATSSPQTSPL